MSSTPPVLSVFPSLLEGVKAKAIGSAFLTTYAFLFSVELWKIMLGLLVLITFDMILGIAAAKTTKEEIRSRKIARTAYKLAVYGLLVSAGHLTDVAVGIPPNWINIETAMVGFLAATELISILENAGRMGFGIPKRILNQLHKYTD